MSLDALSADDERLDLPRVANYTLRALFRAMSVLRNADPRSCPNLSGSQQASLTITPTAFCFSVLVLLIVFQAISLARTRDASKAVSHHQVEAHPEKPPADMADTPDANRCVFCHAAEVAGYSRSPMAHSLRVPLKEPDGTVDLPDEKITIYTSPAGYWQRLESAGEVRDYRIDYVIGSGKHASGYLINLGGRLFQSPIAYYRTRQAYDVAPGYEGLPRPDFTRPIAEGCLFCHSGNALHISGTLNEYRSPIFSAKVITCERCHGPVEKHLADPRAGTIVNPVKLEPAARDGVCEQCHLTGVSRVLNPGKVFSDFLPGQSLEDTFTVYHNVMPAGTIAGPFKVISHVEQFALSACARNSSGRMWCGTCHDPHNEPRDPVRFYRSRCLSCHTTAFSSSHPGKDSDCVGCHMPRRNAKDGGHSAFTDHRIQRRPEAESDLPVNADIAAWREPSLDLQKRNLGIAHIDAGIQRRSQSFIIRGYRELTEVQNQFASDSELFTWMGLALLLGNQSSEAELAFDRALQLGSDSPVHEANLASAFAQAGDVQSAMAHLERAVALDPLYLPAAGPLVSLYRKEGKQSEADALSSKIEAAMHPVSNSASEDKEPDSTGQAQEMAEKVFRNIQALKGVPADQVIPAMEFITSSLGVDCAYCHVQDRFERDDKKAKQTARSMIRMVFAINKGTFAGQRVITCYSCHRGSPNPVAAPVASGSEASRRSDVDMNKLPSNLPTATQLLDNYVSALGGTSAIERITSRFEKGLATSNGKSIPIEIFTVGPDKLALVWHLPNGDSITAFDGHAGWFSVPGRPVRAMQGADLDAAHLDADLQFPLHVRQIFPELRVEYPEQIGDTEAYVVLGIREGHPPVKLFFDGRTGLLVRIVRYSDSLLGLDPQQVDYSEYREVDGVQLPFRIESVRANNSSTIHLDEVRQNIAIDNFHFAEPHSSGASRTR